MSFIRPGQGRKKRAFIRKRPQWDDSLSDLDSYRATPEEVRQRQEAHKSTNHISIKLEKLRKEKLKERRGLTNVEARQVAIMKEVLHDQQQLDNVLTKTDHMLAVVKDLFGDDAKKFTGHPSVTLRPGGGQNNSLPAAPEIRTRIEKLSESVMSQSALNDLSGSSSEEEDDDPEEAGEKRPDPTQFEPRLDLGRFQQIVAEEENRNSNAVPTSASVSQADFQRLQQLQQILLAQHQPPGHSGGVRSGDPNHTLSTISGHPPGTSIQLGGHPQSGHAHSTQLMDPRGVQTPPNSERMDSSGHPTPQRGALNDTGKVKMSRRKVQPQDSTHTNSAPLTMTDMRRVLEYLQAEIADFERKTGRRSKSETQSNETFSGYTVSLVTAVTKLTHYMKETELRLQAEMMVREQLAQDVGQLSVTIDSLTQEMIVTQEEYGKLAIDFHRYRQQTQGEMALLQAQVLELKHLHSAQGSNHSTPGKAASAGSDHGDENYSALPDHVTQPSAAVLLSPVVRKTRVTEDDQTDMAKPKRQTSLVDIPSLVEKSQRQQHHQQLKTATSTSALSMSSASSSDPPRLTQTLPVMATVSVPRPIPLVQSNLGMPLAGSQAAGPLLQMQSGPYMSTSMASSGGAAGMTMAHTAGLSTGTGGGSSSASTSRDANRAMEMQIAELNRQHAEAQLRLQSLLVQQKRQHGQLRLFDDDGEGEEEREGGGRTLPPSSVGGVKGSVVRQEGRIPSSVSPSVSPISHHSERFVHPDPIQRLASMSREIKVSMPVMDLETSAGSLSCSP